jgi:hypothetical protein
VGTEIGGFEARKINHLRAKLKKDYWAANLLERRRNELQRPGVGNVEILTKSNFSALQSNRCTLFLTNNAAKNHVRCRRF